MEHLDTQVLSYAFNGQQRLVEGRTISSVAASEFLVLQRERLRAEYYLPIRPLLPLSPSHPFPDRQHFPWRTADSETVYLGGGYPALREYCGASLARIINARSFEASFDFDQGTRPLPKETRRWVRERFQFLVDAQIKCKPLTKKIAERGGKLFRQFAATHNVKDDYRNTAHDMLILATAIDEGEPLVTEDGELALFAVELGAAKADATPFVLLSFAQPEAKRSNSRESKGFINVPAHLRRIRPESG